MASPDGRVSLSTSPCKYSSTPGVAWTVLKAAAYGGLLHTSLNLCVPCVSPSLNEEMRESKISDGLTICIAQN